jgi:hypothetical protein
MSARPSARMVSAGAPKLESSIWSRLWEEARELSRPLIAYWIFLLAMFGAFSLAVLWTEPSGGSVLALVCMGVPTVVCVALGQVLALLRVRDWVLFALWAFTWTFGVFFGVMGAAAVSFAAAPLAMLILCFVFLGPLFMMGGAWSLATNRTLYATWVPIIYASGTAIVMAESKGKVSAWQAGDKWVIWDLFTFSTLGVGIALMLAYLVSREGHRLHLWRRSERGMMRGSVKEEGASRPRLSCLGWVLLCMMAAGLAVGTAAVAPFLWRTAPADEGKEQTDQKEQQQKDPKKDKKKDKKKKKKSKEEEKRERERQERERREKQQSSSMKDRARHKVDNVREEIEQNLQPAAQQGIDLLTTLLTVLAMLIAALIVFWRPIKRLLLVRHLRDPLLDVAPTTRIEDGWRLVEIAMGDAGVPVLPGEPAVSLARRAKPVLDRLTKGGLEVHGLEEAAWVRDRIVYGLGVGAGDLDLMVKVSHWAYDTVWDRLGDAGQIKALYRGL